MHLPRPYLSYSQFRLWKDNKAAYRAKYYENGPTFETPETIFGKKIAKLLEENDMTMWHVPRYEKPEHKIEVSISGVPVLGYLDSYSPAKRAFYEYKTGHATKAGKAPWDAVSVAKHQQLDFYSLLIEQKEGSVQPQCALVWLETKKIPKTVDFDGMVLTEEGAYLLELTGGMHVFPRKIFKYERDAMRKEIVRVAEDIAEDYSLSSFGAPEKVPLNA